MPKLSLEQVKTRQIEEQRVKTERRISQLRQESRREEVSEVLSVCALMQDSISNSKNRERIDRIKEVLLNFDR
jgi:hypothetical protein